MGVAALVIKILFILGTALAVFWMGHALFTRREAKGRKGRIKGADRRKRGVSVPYERRQGSRRRDDIAEDFMKDLDRR